MLQQASNVLTLFPWFQPLVAVMVWDLLASKTADRRKLMRFPWINKSQILRLKEPSLYGNQLDEPIASNLAAWKRMQDVELMRMRCAPKPVMLALGVSCVLAMEHLAVFLDSRCIDNGEAINLNLNNFSTAIRFCSKAGQ